MRIEIAALALTALAGVVVSPIFDRCDHATGVGHEGWFHGCQGFWAQQWLGLQRMFNVAR